LWKVRDVLESSPGYWEILGHFRKFREVVGVLGALREVARAFWEVARRFWEFLGSSASAKKSQFQNDVPFVNLRQIEVDD
jgi:hypothetical protein